MTFYKLLLYLEIIILGGINLKKISTLMFLLSAVFVLFWGSLNASAEEVNEEFLTYSEDGTVELTYENYILLHELGILDKSELSYDVWVNDNIQPRENEFNSDTYTNDEAFSEETIESYSVESTSNLMKGDILISNGTSSMGLTGHAGIVVGRNQILHIMGSNYHPYITSYGTWEKTYGLKKPSSPNLPINTEVYRISNQTQREAAADWVVRNYYNTNSMADYSLLGSLTSTNPTYCSKIVWQGYYFGPSQALVTKPLALATPYGLPTYFVKSANLKYVFTF